MNFFLKYGLVSAIKNGFVKVSFQENNIVTDWLPVLVRKTKSEKESWQLEINEHVICLMEHDCDEGIVLGAIPSDQDAADPGEGNGKFRKLFSDGTLIEYDRTNSKLTVDVKGDMIANCDGQTTIHSKGALKALAETKAEIEAPIINCKGSISITLESPAIIIKGNVAITGTVSITEGVTAGSIATTGNGEITSAGDIVVQGNIKAIGTIDGTAIKAGNIDLTTHKHSGVQTGSGITGPPSL